MSQQLGPKQTEFVAALRSGKFKQTRLLTRSQEGECYCVMGVALCVIGVIPYFGQRSTHPSRLMNDLGMTFNGHIKLMNMNDDLGFSFPEIAGYIEAEPELYFSEPK